MRHFKDIMFMKKLGAILILIFLLVIPSKWAYFEIDIVHPSRGLIAFLSIVIGFFVAFYLFNSSEVKKN